MKEQKQVWTGLLADQASAHYRERTLAMRYFVALLIAVMFLLTGCGMSYSPMPPPWFEQRLAPAANVSFPAGMRVDQWGSSIVVVTAAGAEPLYLLLPAVKPLANPPEVEVPEGYTVFTRIDRNNLAWWDPYTQVWTEYPSAPRFEISEDFVSTHLGMVIHPNPSNLERPADITPPETQRRKVLIIVGSTPVNVPIELSYTLNPAYDRLVAEYEVHVVEMRRRGNLMIMFFVLYGLGALACIIGGGVLVWLVGGAIIRGLRH